MPKKPCRACGRLLVTNNNSRPEPTCQPCRRKLRIGVAPERIPAPAPSPCKPPRPSKKRRPCRRCGELLYVGRGSLPNPMCRPCRSLEPQLKQRPPRPTCAPVYCTDCDIRIGYALTDTPRCRPCRVKARAQARSLPAPTAARARRTRAQRTARLAALGTHGTTARAAGPCNWCGTQFVGLRTTTRFCSRHCHNKATKRRRATSLAGGTGWRWSDFMRVARKFNYCCAYCGTKPDRLDPDHVIPVARGGHDSLSNLLPTCQPCNSDKRDLLLDEWATDRERRALPPRTTDCIGAQYDHLALSTFVPVRRAA